MVLKIKRAQVKRQRQMVLTQKASNFISIQKNVSIVALANLNVQLKLFLKKVKFLKNGVNFQKLTMIGLAENILANKK